MSDPLNTHTYDGNLSVNHLPDLIFVKELSLDQKRYRGLELINAAKIIPISHQALSFLENIVYSMGTAANIDNTNGLIADDLICMCWIYRENSEFISVLETQLIDMATGFCPQGRTHRLFQTLLAFI